MILINLLPPELRKRSTSYNPLAMAFAGGMAACLLLFLFAAWVHFGKLKQAEQIRDDKTAELETKTAAANKVLEKKAQIALLEERQNKLRELLGRKVYWAHTLDDFANLLASEFPGFHVRCTDLQVTPGAEKRGGDGPTYSFRGRYQLVGDDKTKVGEYLHSMFSSFGKSVFWKQDGFIGKPEDSYVGDHPTVDATIGKTIDTLNLEFQRGKSAKPKAGG
jgi:hypothetical protein